MSVALAASTEAQTHRLAPAQREQPHNLDAEKSALGTVFINPAALAVLIATLQTDDFFLPAHREIFDSMLALDKRGQPIDVLSVADELKTRGMLPRLEGGESYLLALANAVPTAENVAHYAGIVKQKAMLRRLIAACAEIQSSAYGDFGEFDAFLQEAAGKVKKISGDASSPRLASIAVDVTDDWLKDALPPREHLLWDSRTGKGAVDRAGTWLFAAAGGSGKSYAALDLSLAVTTGGSWYGLDTTGRPGRVLLIVAEDDADDLRRRLRWIADVRYPGARVAGGITILPLRGKSISFVQQQDRFTGAFVQGDGLHEVIAYVDESRKATGSPFDLVIVDPVSRFAGVSLDKDSSAATAFINACDALAKAAGGLVLGITHTNKASRSADRVAAEAADVRGSSAQTDGARGVIQMAPEYDKKTRQSTGNVVLSCGKANHLPKWDDVVLRRRDNGVLEPLDAIDHAEWTAARRAEDPEEKRARQEAEREARKDRAAASDIERATRKRAATAARKAAEQAAALQTVRQICAAVSGARARRAAIKAQLSCGSSRADELLDLATGVPVPRGENPPIPPCAPEAPEARCAPGALACLNDGPEAHGGTARHGQGNDDLGEVDS